MVQYIINISIVWLACLLLYELLLRGESFHQYNRIYLIVSLVAGLLLPAANFNGIMPANNNAFRRPVTQVYQIKKAMQVSPIKEPSVGHIPVHNNTVPILWIVYMAGILVGLVLLGNEILGLLRLYRDGNKSYERGYILVETGKEHCPFSFFNIIFIRSRQDYDQAQWALLIAHEKEHSRQLHSLDNLLLIMLRIVFWFHPLPHIYYKRLRMVHEFQADDAAVTNTVDYGAFLLEQNLLQGAPALTHSINYSPIKIRIAMLTNMKSTRPKLLKYLTVFPLLSLLIIFCTQTSFSDEVSRKGNKVYSKGNEIEFGPLKVIPAGSFQSLQQQKMVFMYAMLPDSVLVKDWATGQIKMARVLSDTMPVAINNKPIFGDEPQYMLADTQYTKPVFTGTANNLDAYLFSKLEKDLDKLEDGVYIFRINRMVVDDKGNIAYYENEGIDLFMGSEEEKPLIRADLKHEIDKKIVAVLDGSIKFKPALKDGKPVNVRLGMENYEIVVKANKAKLVKREGC